jgi:hypothetical protein
MPRIIGDITKIKKPPIILGLILGILVAIFLIGSIINSFSGGSAIKVVSAQNVFQSNENPQFIFVYKEKANIFSRLFTSVLNLFDDENKEITATVKILNAEGEEVDSLNPQIKQESSGKFAVDLGHLKFQQELRPGKYKLKFEIDDGKNIYTQEQDFRWGVLAINTNKSIYLPGETAYLQFAVLKDDGHTVCDANLKLKINPSAGETEIQKLKIETELSTKDGTIKYGGKCGPDNVTDVPDYFTYYQVNKPGKYEMKLTNLDNGYEVTDYFEVRESVPFEIERIGPTRIYPLANYEMKMKIKANQDFQGQIIEIVPMTFIVTEAETTNPEGILSHPADLPQKESSSATLRGRQPGTDEGRSYGAMQEPIVENYTKKITWQFEIKKGETKEITYQFKAPNISPYFYLIGPLRLLLSTSSGQAAGQAPSINSWQALIFEESRQWQIASDAPGEYVELYASLNDNAASAWTTLDLSADGVPNNAVVEIVVANIAIGAEYTAGVRASGSALNRYYSIHEAEPAGSDMVTFTVQTDDDAEIEYYSNSVANTAFYLVGYWVCPLTHDQGECYVEKFQALGDVTNSTWKDSNLSAYGPVNDDVAEIVAAVATDNVTYTAGARTNGSAKNRYFELHEAEGGGNEMFTILARADGANATIELWQENANINFTLIGYWDQYLPGSYSEQLETIAVPTSDATWTDRTVSSIGAYNVGEILLLNATEGAGYEMGVRKKGSSLERRLDVHEAEDSAVGATDNDFGRMHVQADSEGVIENYVEDTAAVETFYLVSSWRHYHYISGTCKQADQSTNCNDGMTVKAAINGTLDSGSTTTSGGSWTLTLTSTAPVVGDVVTVFLNTAANNLEAVAVTKWSSADNFLSGIVLYALHLNIGHTDGAQTITNADLSQYDYSVSSDEDVFFEASATSLNVCWLGFGCESAEIYIVPGNSFQPNSGGSSYFETHDIEIDGTLDMTGAGNYASISGSWDNDSVFTPNSSTIFFTASDSAEIVSASAGTTNSFYNLQFGDSATTSYTGQWTLNGAETTFDVNNNLTIGAGTVVNSGTKNVTLAGNLSLAVNGNYTKGSGTFTFDGTSKTWTDSRAAPADMGAVVIDGGGTISLGSSVKATSLNITGSDTLNAAGTYTLTLSGSGTAFTNSGTFTCSTSTVAYEGTSTTTVAALNGASHYYNFNVGLSTDTGTFSYTAAGEIEASGSVTLIAGSSGVHTFDMSTYNLSVGGGAASTGGIAVPAGTVFNQTSGTTKVNSASGTATIGGAGTTKFYDFQIGNASDGVTYTFNLGGDVGASNSFTLAAGIHTLGLSSYEFGIWENFTMGVGTSLSAQTGTLNLGDTNSITLTCSTNCEPYNLIINKTSGTDANDNVTLASNLTVRNTLTITDGQLIQGNYDVRAEGSTAVSIASGTDKEWTNIGTGDLVLGGNFSNFGSVSFSANDVECGGNDDDGGPDDISISSTDTNLKTWSGSGTFNLYNITASYQADSSISCTSCTNSGGTSTWIFANCPFSYLSQAHFRWRNDNGNETAATWKRAEDNTHSGQNRSENVRLRFSIKNTGVQASSNKNYVLQVAPQGGYYTCESVPSASYSDVPTTSGGCGSSVVCMTTSTYFANGDSTINQLTAEGTFVSGKMVEDPSNETQSITINTNYFMEIEYNFQFTSNAAYGANYCFRVTKNGVPLYAYSKVAQITIEGAGAEGFLNRLKGAIRIKGSTIAK